MQSFNVGIFSVEAVMIGSAANVSSESQWGDSKMKWYRISSHESKVCLIRDVCVWVCLKIKPLNKKAFVDIILNDLINTSVQTCQLEMEHFAEH